MVDFNRLNIFKDNIGSIKILINHPLNCNVVIFNILLNILTILNLSIKIFKKTK